MGTEAIRYVEGMVRMSTTWPPAGDWELLGDSVAIKCADCRDVLPLLTGVHACATDPPYGLRFMGKAWDYDVPSADTWRLVLNCLLPGAHLLSFAGTRTQHRMACAIEDAGFEIRDMIAWIYGSGFPKSLDVSKAIDKMAGAERTQVVGTRHRNVKPFDDDVGWNANNTTGDHAYTAPVTDAAKKWAGFGTALKPALEPITVARKPLDGCTVAENVMRYGTGALNIDGCRIGTEVETRPSSRAYAPGQKQPGGVPFKEPTGPMPPGRWPANLIHDGSEEVVALFPETGLSSGGGMKDLSKGELFQGRTNPNITKHCGLGDTGSAARFFYVPKASRADREEGCENIDLRKRDDGRKDDNPGGDNPRNRGVNERVNCHPTVKPTALMAYLCRLVTPPGGIVLDLFMGSGSTGKGALREGFKFIGIELDAHYYAIAKERLLRELAQLKLNL